VPLAGARPRIATIIEDFVVLDDDGQPEPESGYSAIGVTDTAIPSRQVEFSVNAGGLVRDEMMLHVGGILHPTDPLMVKYNLFREHCSQQARSGSQLGLVLQRPGGAIPKSQSFPVRLYSLLPFSASRGLPFCRPHLPWASRCPPRYAPNVCQTRDCF
jgi:hypothetical protein